MEKKLNRRGFLGNLSALLLFAPFLKSCNPGENRAKAEGSAAGSAESPADRIANKISENQKMPRDLVKKMLDQKVDHYMNLSFHCAQSSFMALKEQFGLEGDDVVKALTPMAGIAERGETCGAVSGPLMAFGLLYGRDKNRLDDWDTYRKSLVPSGQFCDRFEAKYGSTMCHDVQELKFGRCYRLMEPEELRQFQEDGSTTHCSEVVRSAVKMAAEIILENPDL